MAANAAYTHPCVPQATETYTLSAGPRNFSSSSKWWWRGSTLQCERRAISLLSCCSWCRALNCFSVLSARVFPSSRTPPSCTARQKLNKPASRLACCFLSRHSCRSSCIRTAAVRAELSVSHPPSLQPALKCDCACRVCFRLIPYPRAGRPSDTFDRPDV